jgi:hypothetical protein
VDQLAGEAVAAGPVGQIGVMVEPCGDDDCRRLQIAAVRSDAPATVYGLHLLHLGVEPDIDSVMRGITLQIGDPRIARWILAVPPASSAKPGLGRHPAGRVQPQPVVARSPARTDLVGLLDDNALDPRATKRRRGSKAPRPGAADDRPLHVIEATPGSRNSATDEIRRLVWS